jgi:hypothetical protein
MITTASSCRTSSNRINSELIDWKGNEEIVAVVNIGVLLLPGPMIWHRITKMTVLSTETLLVQRQRSQLFQGSNQRYLLANFQGYAFKCDHEIPFESASGDETLGLDLAAVRLIGTQSAAEIEELKLGMQ